MLSAFRDTIGALALLVAAALPAACGESPPIRDGGPPAGNDARVDAAFPDDASSPDDDAGCACATNDAGLPAMSLPCYCARPDACPSYDDAVSCQSSFAAFLATETYTDCGVVNVRMDGGFTL